MIQHVPDQFIPLCARLDTQRSLCQRSMVVERCRGEWVVGWICFTGAHSRLIAIEICFSSAQQSG